MSAAKLVEKATYVVVKGFHLKNIKRIEIKFDPFSASSSTIRLIMDLMMDVVDIQNIAQNFLFFISSGRVRQSNIKCSVKTSVVNDRSEPLAYITTETGHKYILKAGNLTTLEFVQEYDKILKKHNPDPVD